MIYNTPNLLYLKELKFRLLYIIFSFCITFFCLIVHFNSVILICIKPLIELGSCKFLVIHLFELFNLKLTLCSLISSIITLPFVSYQLQLFLYSSWYNYQIILFNYYYWFIVIITIFSAFTLNYILAPSIIIFFSSIYYQNNFNITNLNFNLQISSYLVLFFTLYINVYVLIYIFFGFFIICIGYCHPFSFYFLIKPYKKYLFLLLLSILFFLNPPDYFLQVILMVIVFLFTEILFFLSCTKKCFSW